jgi:hypothetical protein
LKYYASQLNYKDPVYIMTDNTAVPITNTVIPISFEQKTVKDVTYFPLGTRRYDFVHYLENIGIANLFTRTVLAPMERWRIIRQTQGSLMSNRLP